MGNSPHPDPLPDALAARHPRPIALRNRARRLADLEARLGLVPQTTRQLAAAFGVTPRSIQRDLDTLRETGREVVRDHRGAYHLPQRGEALSPAEALAVYPAVCLLHRHAPGRHSRAALDRIARGLPQHLRPLLQASPQDTGAAPAGDTAPDLVLAAWLNRRVLRFDHRGPGGVTERGHELHVYSVEIGDDLALHVTGLETRHHGLVRTYSLSRMEHLALLPGGDELPGNFDPRAPLTGGRDPITVRVRFDPEAASRVLEGSFPGITVVGARSHGDGRVELDLRAAADATGLPRELIPFLLGWGPQVEVLSPPHVRDHWLGQLRAALERYDPAFRAEPTGAALERG